MLVAMIALVLAVAGTSVAAINSLTKKQKSQTRRIAQGEIAKAAPGLSVAHAKQADGVAAGSIGPSGLSKSIPAAHVTRTGTPQSTLTGAETRLSFNSERYDTAGMHDNATNDSRLTAPIDGIYEITAQIQWQAALASEHELIIRRNGSADIALTADNTSGGGQSATTQVQLHAGDYVEAFVFQESADGVNVEIDSESSPEFAMTWLAPGP